MMFAQRLIDLLKSQRAFSLLESLIALGILAFVGLVVISAIDTNSRAEGTLDEQVTGTHLATACIEQLRKADYAADYSAVSDNISMGGYSINLIIECTTDGETFDTCTGGETLQKITIQVLKGEKPVYSTCTFKSSFQGAGQ